MASVFYVNGLHRTFNKLHDFASGGDAFKLLLLEAVTTTPFDPDHDFVNDIVADEFSDTGYIGGFGGAGRQAIDNPATDRLTKNLTSNRVEFDFADETWTALGGTNNVVGAAMILEITNDAASPVICAWDTTDTATNGQDFTLVVGSTGAVHIA